MEGFIHDAYTLKALKQVRLGRSFFITGKAGTGKTTLLKEIVKECRSAHGVRPVCTQIICTFAMSLMILLVLICSTKVSEKSDMAKS